MKIDLISYCQDIEALRLELIERNYIDESGKPFFPLANKTPTENKNTPTTVTLIRCLSDADIELLESFTSLENLGTKDEVDEDTDKTSKYESAYSRDSYQITDSETGEVHTLTPPYWHGGFY